MKCPGNYGGYQPQEGFMGVPVTGGLIDSVIGIVTGAVAGIAPQALALVRGPGVPV
ncbi:hypothetical protein GCM10009544_67220 [Streptomyces stramineus]|uniref:Uncharacterized protein n=1 Tax=Streptomyces stramineus TaxID=173861 RepID=A0ABP3LIV8_9ACTN